LIVFRQLTLYMLLVLLAVIVAADPVPPSPQIYSVEVYLSPGEQLPPDYFYGNLPDLNTERLDIPQKDGSYTIYINDYTTRIHYALEAHGTCFWTPINKDVAPFFYFPNNEYLGKIRCPNTTEYGCSQWQGCQPYYHPPAPFYLSAKDDTNEILEMYYPSHRQHLFFVNWNYTKMAPDVFSHPPVESCTLTPPSSFWLNHLFTHNSHLQETSSLKDSSRILC